MLDTRHSVYPAGHSEHWLHIVFLWVYEELDMPSASNAAGHLQVSLVLLCTALQRHLDNSHTSSTSPTTGKSSKPFSWLLFLTPGSSLSTDQWRSIPGESVT